MVANILIGGCRLNGEGRLKGEDRPQPKIARHHNRRDLPGQNVLIDHLSLSVWHQLDPQNGSAGTLPTPEPLACCTPVAQNLDHRAALSTVICVARPTTDRRERRRRPNPHPPPARRPPSAAPRCPTGRVAATVARHCGDGPRLRRRTPRRCTPAAAARARRHRRSPPAAD